MLRTVEPIKRHFDNKTNSQGGLLTMNTKQVRPWMWRLAVVAGLSLLITGPLLYKASADRAAAELVARAARDEAPVDISLAGRRFLFPRKYIFLPTTDEDRTPRDATGRFVYVEGQPKALVDFGFYLSYPNLQYLHWSSRTRVPVTNRLLVSLRSKPLRSTSKNILTIFRDTEVGQLKGQLTRSSLFGLTEVVPLSLDSEYLYFQESEGLVTTLISCTRARTPGGISMCDHQTYLRLQQYEVLLQLSYPKSRLQEWALVENRVRALIKNFEVN